MDKQNHPDENIVEERITVFISYKRENQDFAEQLWKMLQQWGYEPWLDVKDIEVGISQDGTGWDRSIDKGLRQSNALIGLITPEALRSENVQNEWIWAKLTKRRILLLRLSPFDIEEMPHQFVTVNWIDCVEDELTGLSRLREELKQLSEARDDFKQQMQVEPEPTAIDSALREERPIPDYLKEKTKPKRRQPWRWMLRVIAGLTLIVSFIWLVFDLSFEPLLVLLGAIAGMITSWVGENSDDGDIRDKGKLSDVEQMRKRVYQYWVQGVMETALSDVQQAGIGVDMQPDAVIRDEARDIGDITLPNDSRHVRKVYDTFDSFLILGDPGAGKTIMLLQLAEDLILSPPPVAGA